MSIVQQNHLLFKQIFVIHIRIRSLSFLQNWIWWHSDLKNTICYSYLGFHESDWFWILQGPILSMRSYSSQASPQGCNPHVVISKWMLQIQAKWRKASTDFTSELHAESVTILKLFIINKNFYPDNVWCIHKLSALWLPALCGMA